MSLYQRAKLGLKSLMSSGEDGTSAQLNKLYKSDDVDDDLIRSLEKKLQQKSPKDKVNFQRDLMLGAGGGLGAYGVYQASGIGKQSSAEEKDIDKESSINPATIAAGAGISGLGILGFNNKDKLLGTSSKEVQPTDMPLGRHQLRQLARRRAERRRAAM